MPQRLSMTVLHPPPLQQPVQLLVLQPDPTHIPPMQVALPHAPDAPQRQSPAGEQLSDLLGLQVTQAAPPTPQVASAEAVQTPARQQPFGQLAALQLVERQVPALHSWLPIVIQNVAGPCAMAVM